jgi:hypothetical protein
MALLLGCLALAKAEVWVPATDAEGWGYAPPTSLSVQVGTLLHPAVDGSRVAYDVAYHQPLVGVLWDRFHGMVGMSALAGASHFFYGGVGVAVPLTEQLRIGGSVAPGYYHDRGNLPLGSALIVRTQGWVGLQYSPHQLLSLDWSHFSQTEVLGMTYQLQW